MQTPRIAPSVFLTLGLLSCWVSHTNTMRALERAVPLRHARKCTPETHLHARTYAPTRTHLQQHARTRAQALTHARALTNAHSGTRARALRTRTHALTGKPRTLRLSCPSRSSPPRPPLSLSLRVRAFSQLLCVRTLGCLRSCVHVCLRGRSLQTECCYY